MSRYADRFDSSLYLSQLGYTVLLHISIHWIPSSRSLGLASTRSFNFSRVREPYIRKLLVRRAVVVTIVTFLIDAALCALFIFMPGSACEPTRHGPMG